jgi:DNA-binding NtrC family response regulator
MKLLIIDDNEDVLLLMEYFLKMEKSTIKIKGVLTGKEGLSIFIEEEKNEPFTAIISDIKMPGLTGLDVCREIKKIKPELPFFLITAHDTVKFAEELSSLGIPQVISKAISFQKIAKDIIAELSAS